MKRHTVRMCKTCECRRWFFHGWMELNEKGGVTDTDISISFCSQGHPTIFKIGIINRLFKEIMLPGLFEALNNRNPLSSFLRHH